MKIRMPKIRIEDIPVYEHLAHYVKKTSYAHRLQWLEDANQFVNTLRRKKGYPNLSWKS